MDDRPIGVFDSGVGGLTFVREIRKCLPNEDLIYFGDTARVPYGTRDYKTIQKYVQDDIRFLNTFDVKLIVAACGTASSVAWSVIEDNPIKTFGVVKPSVEEALRVTKNNRVGVIATDASIKSGVYLRILKSMNPNVEIWQIACPMFVPLIENNYMSSSVIDFFISEYLSPLKLAEIDTLILGCTHFPLISNKLSNFFDGNVNLINSGRATAKSISEFLSKNFMLKKKSKSCTRFFLSSKCENFHKISSEFLGESIDEISIVDVECL